ncbi:hypothetical protein DB41_GS00010 [Neochlamydia sp. TUME1]|uniref:hypothetical protein n=1 Tax=Neochlamydia sp. TUME1 TaxID=1478174 RepID=UPI00058269FF|nr:hypothetical protein [Neochlamydia sp. TUME1]KIC75977.1 hypothetical protein DB41_GS00010 [Neochlamydia sp. TUME1]
MNISETLENLKVQLGEGIIKKNLFSWRSNRRGRQRKYKKGAYMLKAGRLRGLNRSYSHPLSAA